MKGNGKLLPSLFSSFSKSCQKWNTLGRVELIPTVLCVCVCMCVCVCARARARAGGWGAPQRFLAQSCFYNSLSTDLCPLPGLSWEFLRSKKLLGS